MEIDRAMMAQGIPRRDRSDAQKNAFEQGKIVRLGNKRKPQPSFLDMLVPKLDGAKVKEKLYLGGRKIELDVWLPDCKVGLIIQGNLFTTTNEMTDRLLEKKEAIMASGGIAVWIRLYEFSQLGKKAQKRSIQTVYDEIMKIRVNPRSFDDRFVELDV